MVQETAATIEQITAGLAESVGQRAQIQAILDAQLEMVKDAPVEVHASITAAFAPQFAPIDAEIKRLNGLRKPAVVKTESATLIELMEEVTATLDKELGAATNGQRYWVSATKQEDGSWTYNAEMHDAISTLRPTGVGGVASKGRRSGNKVYNGADYGHIGQFTRGNSVKIVSGSQNVGEVYSSFNEFFASNYPPFPNGRPAATGTGTGLARAKEDGFVLEGIERRPVAQVEATG